MIAFPYRLVDVFSAVPLGGNSLTVFRCDGPVPDALLHGIAREMRQFESIFLWSTADARTFAARIFTMEEELSFAGHPVLGAAAALHLESFAALEQVELTLALGTRQVSVASRRRDHGFSVEMDQGVVEIGRAVPPREREEILDALGLSVDDLMAELPMEVVSTGLPYLIVPVRRNLGSAAIVSRRFGDLLARHGAQFVYVLDVPSLEGRTWDNDGRVEDIATGSAAGPAAAYLVRHGYARAELPLILHQGRFLGRPSQLIATVSEGEGGLRVRLRGDVTPVGTGSLQFATGLQAP